MVFVKTVMSKPHYKKTSMRVQTICNCTVHVEGVEWVATRSAKQVAKGIYFFKKPTSKTTHQTYITSSHICCWNLSAIHKMRFTVARLKRERESIQKRISRDKKGDEFWTNRMMKPPRPIFPVTCIPSSWTSPYSALHVRPYLPSRAFLQATNTPTPPGSLHPPSK